MQIIRIQNIQRSTNITWSFTVTCYMVTKLERILGIIDIVRYYFHSINK